MAIGAGTRKRTRSVPPDRDSDVKSESTHTGTLTEIGPGGTSVVPPATPTPLTADPGVPGILPPFILVVRLIIGVPIAAPIETPGGLPGPGLGSGFSPAAICAALRASSLRRTSLVIRSCSALTSRS